MGEVKKKTREEPEFTEVFKNVPVTSLRAVMTRTGERYKAQYPLFEKKRNKLLLNRGQAISSDLFTKMELENARNMRLLKSPLYYVQERTTDVSFN